MEQAPRVPARTGSDEQVTDTQLDLLSGPELRDAGIAKVDEHAGEWRHWADAAIANLAHLTRTGVLPYFTAENVRDLAGDPPHPNQQGGRFLAAIRAGKIRRVGWMNSTRPEAHACRLAQYVGV